MGRLEEVDLSQDLGKREEEEGLKHEGARLAQLRLTLGGLIGECQVGPPLVVVFEGWDASGKGGAIKRLVAPLDPRHVRVSQFAAPTPDEKRHHFLGRFWPALPGWGGMTVFDRSWYGRVLVERVEGFASEEQWRRAYGEIDDFERTLADEDWRNREKRPQYEAAVEEMLERTDRENAPWRVIAAESKRFARLEVVRAVNEEIEKGMRRAGQEPPPRP